MLPARGRELLFDIETDPMADHCYLHGVVERWTDGSGRPTKYHAFISSGPEDEARAFVEALEFLEEDPSASVIYWSKYERTVFRALAQKYPDTNTADRVDALFSSARCVDLLYDVVSPLLLEILSREHLPELGRERGGLHQQIPRGLVLYDHKATEPALPKLERAEIQAAHRHREGLVATAPEVVLGLPAPSKARAVGVPRDRTVDPLVQVRVFKLGQNVGRQVHREVAARVAFGPDIPLGEAQAAAAAAQRRPQSP